MVKRLFIAFPFVLALCTLPAAQAPQPKGGGTKIPLGDWPEARGPHGDGRSDEKGLIDKWALNGQNFLWRVPYGGRSAPVVMGDRVYVQNPAGLGDVMQERVMALDADTGKVIWQYKFNVFQSDVPPHRVGWASPAIDPETGNIYAMGVGATVIALNKDGKLLWDRSIGEEFSAFTTHGGRTTSPTIDGNLVIVSAAISSWGAGASRQHRFVALDKRTGEIIWITSPGGRPYDTNYAAPLITTINGLRLLISGSGDGGVYAMKPQTGEKVWGTVIAKRAVNTGVAVSGSTVIVSHGDENLDVPDLGMIAAMDGSQTGDIKTYKWAQKGEQYGFSSPVIDGNHVYEIESGSRLHAYDLETGRPLWQQQLGTIQKAPLVLADGKLYVGTESGKFFIVRPGADKAEILSEVEMPNSTDENAGQTAGIPEPIFGGAAISRGRIFFVSTGGVYAIGAKKATAPAGWTVDEPLQKGEEPATWLQVYPTEVVLKAGEKQTFHVRTFDAKGRFLREEARPTWAVTGFKGTMDPNGTFTPDRRRAIRRASSGHGRNAVG
jgi:outer membrane protein assembly factor BamB